MSNVGHTVPTFERIGMPFAYDLLVRAIYAPVGGESALRRAAVERLEFRPGDRVLELGCGTGSFTRLLLEKGARVTSLDGSARMLERARKKASEANFQQVDLRTFEAPADASFDVVFFGFVLHELPRATREALLVQAKRCLAPNGRVVIVDHAVPQGPGLASGWRRFLIALEPPTVREVLAAGYEAELAAARFDVVVRESLARGAASLLVARPEVF
jgi:ubiquinone/menaquinone biosynthesis C-methylase UbiE